MRLRIHQSDRMRDLIAALVECWPRQHDALMALCDAERGVELTVKEIEADQTSAQRGFYRVSLKAWGAELGYSARESELLLHNAVLCEAYGVEKTVRYGDTVIEIPRERSAGQPRAKYSELIETLLRMASESGYPIPDPRAAASTGFERAQAALAAKHHHEDRE